MSSNQTQVALASLRDYMVDSNVADTAKRQSNAFAGIADHVDQLRYGLSIIAAANRGAQRQELKRVTREMKSVVDAAHAASEASDQLHTAMAELQDSLVRLGVGDRQ